MAVASACITDLTATQLEDLAETLGEPKYRAKQVQTWVYQRLALSFEEMTDLPKFFRQGLAGETRLHSLVPVREVAGHDGTVKALFTLADDKTIESTLMPYPNTRGRSRCTVCVSTQVGCPIGCPFCATGQQGFERNLTSGEIIDQVLYFARHLRRRESPGCTLERPVTNLVFMGMGEPLANYDALLLAVGRLNSPEGFGLGARHMSVSTAGLVPQIERLSRENLQIGLAVSLHAGENKLRDRLVPINRKYPLERLLPACRKYYQATGRRPSFEYVLFDGINDSISQARSLVRLTAGWNCHVNLIQANRTADRAYQPSPEKAVLAFERELRRSGVNCTLRQPRGQDIDAGCGQLRSRFGAFDSPIIRS